MKQAPNSPQTSRKQREGTRWQGIDPVNLDGFSIDPSNLRQLAEVYGRLAAYADQKAAAMELRLKGDIEAACRRRACETTNRPSRNGRAGTRTDRRRIPGVAFRAGRFESLSSLFQP